MSRKMMDCREFPSESKCTLTITGEEDEVLRAAVMHAVDVHGHHDTPEFRNELRKALRSESQPTARR
jgi:predicted small metal-binding protein